MKLFGFYARQDSFNFKSAILLAALFAVLTAHATFYTDATNELFGVYPNLDIVSVEITNDLTDITFIISVDEIPITNDWGRYMIAIDSEEGGLTNFNAWYPRPISLSSGLEYWFGCWINSGGGRELYHWREDYAAFDILSYFGGNPIISDNTISVSIPLASLGLSDGDTFVFDVFTSDGGISNSAIDALSDPAETIPNWTAPYASTSELSYTVGGEPPPAILIIDREITGVVHHYTPPEMFFPGEPGYVTDELLFDTNGLSNVDLSQYDTFKLRLHAPAGQKLVVDHEGEYTSALNIYYHNYGQPDSSSHTETTTLEFEQFAGTMPSNTYSLCYIGDLGNVLEFNRHESYSNQIEFSALSYTFTAAYNPTNVPKDFIQRSSSSIPMGFHRQTFSTNDPGPFVTIVIDVDTDGDGQSDTEEFIAGSDPNNSNAYFRIYNAFHEGSGFVVSWEPCVTGRWYEVLWSSDLTTNSLSLDSYIEYPQNSYTDATHNAENAGFYKIHVELQ